MFKRRTLFILGAGASCEAGLPTGVALAKIIREKMDVRFGETNKLIGEGDHSLYAHIRNTYPKDGDTFWKAARRIKAGLGFAQSIDDFLDQHRSDAHVNLYGKAAIVRAILEAEAESKFHFDRFTSPDGFNPDKFADTWFAKFMYMLGRRVPRENVSGIFDNVRFIVFNYDRCVEHFLFNAIKRLYHLSDEEALLIIDGLQFIHPYGVIGSLREIEFGARQANYLALAEGIKTYTEQIEAAGIIEQIANEVYHADCIVFLGFAYHSQNMEMLKPQEPINAVSIFGTAYKMSASDVNVVTHQLANFKSTRDRLKAVHLEHELTCAGLFDHYSRSLSGE
jgi:hypothetical protein